MKEDNSLSRVIQHLEQLAATASPGESLPSVRSLAADHAASPVTIVKAISELSARGLVYTEPGRGTFVARRRPPRTADVSWQPQALSPALVDPAVASALDQGAVDETSVPLSSGYRSADLPPRRALRLAAGRAMRRGDVWSAAPAAGMSALRSVFATMVDLDPSQILVTAGSQAALSQVFRALSSPGDPVVVESPTYAGALAVARAAGLRPVPVPADDEGLRPDFLDDVLARSRARLVYLQSAVSNPAGSTLSAGRRKELLEIVAARGVLVIDDDWARHLPLDTLPPPLIVDDVDGHVIHLSSLAKPVAPSLRVGFLAARGPALDRLHTAAVVDNLFVSRALQETALEFLGSPDWPRHRRTLTRVLKGRRAHLADLVATHWPTTGPVGRPAGGYHLWVPCPPGSTSTELTRAARAAGVVIGDGAQYFADEAASQHVRLSFGAANEPAMSQAVARLGELLPSH